MANQTFDSVILNQLERPLSSDLNAAQSDGHRDLRDWLNKTYARRLGGTATNDATATLLPGFVADSLRVVPPSPAALAVSITPGLGFAANPSPTTNVGGVLGLNDLSPYSPIVLSQAQAVTLAPAPGAGFARVDLIQVKVNRRLTDVTSRDIFNPGTLTFGPVNVAKTMSFDSFGDLQSVVAPAVGSAGIVYKQGVQFAYAVADDFLTAPLPAVDPGYLPLAYINVTPAMASVTAGDIRDERPLLFPNNALSIGAELTMRYGSNFPAGSGYALVPPGVQQGFVLTAVAGVPLSGEVYNCIVAGNTSLCGFSEVADAWPDSYTGASLLGATISSSAVTVVDSTFQSAAAAGVRPMTLAIGQKIYTSLLTLRKLAVAGANVNWTTPSAGDDRYVRVQISGSRAS